MQNITEGKEVKILAAVVLGILHRFIGYSVLHRILAA